MKKPFLIVLPILVVFLFLYTSAFAQTGQIASDYPTIKNRNIAVIVIDFPDTPQSIKDQYFPTISDLRDTIFNGSIKKYFSDMSFGQFTLTGDIFGYFTHQSPGYVKGGCLTMENILKINSINIPGFDINKYDGFAIVPINDAQFDGAMYSNNEFLINGEMVHKDFIYVPIFIGYYDRDSINNPNLRNDLKDLRSVNIPIDNDQLVNGDDDIINGNVINYSTFNNTFSHELGHFLGFGRHANSRTNGTSYDYEPEISNNNCLCYGTGSVQGSLLSNEYGNRYDVMGNGEYGLSLNMGFRDILGWTNSSNRFSIKDYGHFTTTIFPINYPNGIRAIEIRTPYSYNEEYNYFKKNKGYFLEVRSGSYKWDRRLKHPQLQGNNDGIMVMKTDGWSSELLDMSPSANFNIFGYIRPDIRDVVLKPGMVYKNKEIQLSNVRKNPDGSFSVDIDVYVSEPKVNLNDSLALVALYDQCNGENWSKKKNWLIGRVQTWEGILVENGRVVVLDLENVGLTGKMPEEFTNLTGLRNLNLNRNQITEIIRESWLSLVNMEQLAFYGNQLTCLPDLSGMSKLKNLDCRSNFLDFGDIEPYIGFPKYGFWYEPQCPVGKWGIVMKKPGEEFHISVTIEGNSNNYQWYKDGESISGATQAEYVIPSVEFSDAGDYTCQIINTIATKLILQSYPISLKISNETVISDVLGSTLKVYPNPTTGIIKIDGLPSYRENVIIIQSLDGKLIRKSSTSSATENIDIRGQVTGTYLLLINDQPFKVYKK